MDAGDFSEIDIGDAGAEVRNFVFFIGDGMSLNHVNATSMNECGEPGGLFFQQFPVQAMMATASADCAVTGSAAAATAMATGRKVNNYTVGLANPGDGSALPNMIEFFKEQGKATGLVTTATITDGTPAGFGAHTADRSDYADIARDYLSQARINVLFGAHGKGMTQEMAEANGYTVIDTLFGFDPMALNQPPFLSGQFYEPGKDEVLAMPYELDGLEEGIPRLHEMSTAAVSTLLTDPDGFFLMIEGAKIDQASHANQLSYMISEVSAFEEAVAAVTTDERLASNTLFVVTADHGTGGLVIDGNNGVGEMPDAHWTSTTHSGEDVPVYVSGSGAEIFDLVFDAYDGRIDNTAIFHIVTKHISW